MKDSPADPTWPSRIGEIVDQAPSPDRVQAYRLADAVRRVIDGVAVTAAAAALLAAAADALEAVAADIDAAGVRSVTEGFAESSISGDPRSHFDHSPIMGEANPLAPPLRLHVADDHTVTGEVVFGAAYEGPPGCVHGGYVAAAFDEILGFAQSLSGQTGMTGSLTVDYRSPTPLHEPLTLVGRFERADGRKIHTSGTIHAGERLCAEATGLFIAIDFAAMARARAARTRDDGATPAG